MPKVRAIDERNETELRAELVSLLADAHLVLLLVARFAVWVDKGTAIYSLYNKVRRRGPMRKPRH